MELLALTSPRPPSGRLGSRCQVRLPWRVREQNRRATLMISAHTRVPERGSGPLGYPPGVGQATSRFRSEPANRQATWPPSPPSLRIETERNTPHRQPPATSGTGCRGATTCSDLQWRTVPSWDPSGFCGGHAAKIWGSYLRSGTSPAIPTSGGDSVIVVGMGPSRRAVPGLSHCEGSNPTRGTQAGPCQLLSWGRVTCPQAWRTCSQLDLGQDSVTSRLLCGAALMWPRR